MRSGRLPDSPRNSFWLFADRGLMWGVLLGSLALSAWSIAAGYLWMLPVWVAVFVGAIVVELTPPRVRDCTLIIKSFPSAPRWKSYRSDQILYSEFESEVENSRYMLTLHLASGEAVPVWETECSNQRQIERWQRSLVAWLTECQSHRGIGDSDT